MESHANQLRPVSGRPSDRSVRFRAQLETVVPTMSRRPSVQENGPSDGLGEVSLIAITSGIEARGSDIFRVPCSVEVEYYLRPLTWMLQEDEIPCLAVLDVQALWRLAMETQPDAGPEAMLRAAERPEAARCLTTSSGMLLPLRNLLAPSKVNVPIWHLSQEGVHETAGECSMLARIVVTQEPEDPLDWRAVGPPLVIRTKFFEDMVGTPLPLPLAAPSVPWFDYRRLTELLQGYSDSSDGVTIMARKLSYDPKLAALPVEMQGVKLQALLGFYDTVREELSSYCKCHRRIKGSVSLGFIVCVEDPCPYVSLPLGHAGQPFMSCQKISSRDHANLVEMTADMRLVSMRYGMGPLPTEDHTIKEDVTRKPKSARKRKGDSVGRPMIAGEPMLTPQERLQAQRSRKLPIYVTYSWSEPFSDVLETLERALDHEEVVFLPGLFGSTGPDVLASDGTFRPERRRREALSMLSGEHVRKVIVSADRACSITSCAHSCRELYEAWRWQVPTFVWPHRETNLHTFERAVRNLKLSESEGQCPECEISTYVGGPAVGVRELLQAGLYTYVKTLEKATTLRALNRDRAQRLFPELEYRQALETSQRRLKKALEAWENKGYMVEAEITCCNHKLTLDRQERSQGNKGTSKMSHVRQQNEKMARDKMSELAWHTCVLEKRLDPTKSRLALKETQVLELERSLERDLQHLEKELEEQEQRARASMTRRAMIQQLQRERRAMIRQLQQNLHSLD